MSIESKLTSLTPEQEGPGREIQANVLEEIITERDRQDEKWGVQHHSPERWLAILAEEVGEAAKEVIERGGELLDEEVVQVAAVAVAWLEDLRRR